MKNAHILALTLATVLVCAASADAADAPLVPQRGVLMLTNGQLLEGTITPAGDRYDVLLQNGEVRVKKSQVALVARSAQECYQHKRGEIEVGRVQDYLALAEWCLQNNLRAEAAREIEAAKKADPQHPKIPLVEARLTLAAKKPETPQPTKTADAAAARKPLDAVVRHLPGGSVENFTNHIQPLLLNYCARAGCHQQSTGTMRLERISLNRYTGRKATQRNLQSVLASIDRDHPDQSKLLQAPIRPHGGNGLPIFTDRDQSQYRQLVQWVYQVCGTRAAPAAPTLAERTAPLMERGPHAAEVVEPPRVAPATLPATDEPSALAPASGEEIPRVAPKTLPPLEGKPNEADDNKGDATPDQTSAAPREAFVPRDPFDPEIFNRRFFGR
jgi:hypothetical protein